MKSSDTERPEHSALVRWFAEISIDDIGLVGGKNASLGEMYRELVPQGVRVPNGFAVTTEGYSAFLEANDLGRRLATILGGIDTGDLDDLRERGRLAREAVLGATIPDQLRAAIVEAYRRLCGGSVPPGASVAVRSSATAEDLPDASFAGQQETFLNVEGEEALLDRCRRCFASLFTDRAISYRADHGFDHDRVALSIGIQEMVRSDLAASGVMFTIDTDSGFADVVLINAAYGLGENVVKGVINPDEYYVFKPTLAAGYRPILQKIAGSKESKLIYESNGEGVANVAVPDDLRVRFAISDDDILTLARWACLIETHYGAKRGRPTPMDIEWAVDGRSGELFILQARPETVQSRRSRDVLQIHRLQKRGPVLISGRAVGDHIASGPVRVVREAAQLHEVRDGEVLVADKTDPDWEPIMKRAAAIVTNRGGRTCHAAIVSRELGLAAIVGTENATETLRTGQMVTVSCAEGETGRVYEGALPFDVETLDLKGLERPRTKIMMNVANPGEALALSFIPNDGVGLAREEFIISNYVPIHPLALLGYDDLEDSVRADVDRLTAGYDDKPQFFVDELAHGVAMIAAAFYPKDVIVRLSDFKTNEYAHLVGGEQFEPSEENPMIGFRGASRYYDERYRDGFGLECRAMKKVREEMGLNNVKLMIPFCRTVEEARRVQAEMKKHGLERGVDGLELYVMCEIPSNVVLAEEFAELFDGFSIGSNDLTQLILGVDRDSEIIAHLFDERNPAVTRMIAQVIERAHVCGAKIGICGQAPSDYPEFAAFLVDCGIDSISLNPDAVARTTLQILELEQKK